MTYTISDIHGEYDQFMTILEKIHFSDSDTLYVLGDVVDRGEHPIKVLQYMMGKSNIVPICGNHEVMALTNLRLLMNELTEDFLDNLSLEKFWQLADWIQNGSESTIKEFAGLSMEEKQDILEYLGEFLAYEEISVGDRKYLLVHAGIADFSPERPLWDYEIDDFVWQRTDYKVPYYNDVSTITGHTPTQTIVENQRPGYIFRANNHIAIDCGAFYKEGRLAAICLDTNEEFYSKI
ncbi:MAG: metallophosphoesterase [Lachnospiraceae bacterium]|nr:metallophosphoesterase [Lachnospiraceae bacterium]MDY4840158.1 metallophosphoesterase [Lachnospiraceae bacterium]MEE1249736.1 metallophosphoesterase [Lachnospiraceae bacterium]